MFRFRELEWIIVFVGVVIAYWLVGSYKRVFMGDGALYISNYLREIRIPIEEVETVNGPWSWISNTPEIVIRLRCRSSFGQRIRFAPRLLFSRETAEQLRLEVERRNKSLP